MIGPIQIGSLNNDEDDELKVKNVFSFVNQWSQLFGKFNWYDITFIEISMMRDIAVPGYEFWFVILGLGFYIRINREWEDTDIGKSLKELYNLESEKDDDLES